LGPRGNVRLSEISSPRFRLALDDDLAVPGAQFNLANVPAGCIGLPQNYSSLHFVCISYTVRPHSRTVRKWKSQLNREGSRMRGGIIKWLKVAVTILFALAMAHAEALAKSGGADCTSTSGTVMNTGTDGSTCSADATTGTGSKAVAKAVGDSEADSTAADNSTATASAKTNGDASASAENGQQSYGQ
jgi:hypothetical protein